MLTHTALELDTDVLRFHVIVGDISAVLGSLIFVSNCGLIIGVNFKTNAIQVLCMEILFHPSWTKISGSVQQLQKRNY